MCTWNNAQLCTDVCWCGFPPWAAHKGPSLRCPRAPLSAPRCSPAPPWPLTSATTLPPTEWHLLAITRLHHQPYLLEETLGLSEASIWGRSDSPTFKEELPSPSYHWRLRHQRAESTAECVCLKVRFCIGSITSTGLIKNTLAILIHCTGCPFLHFFKSWRMFRFSDKVKFFSLCAIPSGCNFLEDVQVLTGLGHHLLLRLQAHLQQRRPAVYWLVHH